MLAYLWIDLSTLAFPLAFSRSARFGFGKGPAWRNAWIAVTVSAAPFILWDFLFTRLGVWEFNPKYLAGPRLLGLPVEELLFFWAIPFACLFIYRNLENAAAAKSLSAVGPATSRRPSAFSHIHRLSDASLRLIWGGLSVACLSLAVLHSDKLYTQSVGLLGGVTAGLLGFFRPGFSGRLLLALLLQYLPFLIVNGLLTALPVVTYRAEDILGFRIGSIPLEDSIYSFVMLVLPVSIYEGLQT